MSILYDNVSCVLSGGVLRCKSFEERIQGGKTLGKWDANIKTWNLSYHIAKHLLSKNIRFHHIEKGWKSEYNCKALGVTNIVF